ncbi:MAG: prohibitin family protein [Vampirovibrionales bacterium]|nr:prohibitin family protein [Vampirovibrionales bacterium]
MRNIDMKPNSTDPRHYLESIFRAGNVTLWIVGALALLIVFNQFFVIIPPGFRGVSVTLGKVDSRFRGEGLNFKLPFIENIERLPVRQQTVSGEAPCFSSDLQTVTVSFKALIRIPEQKVVELYQKFQGDPYDTLVEPQIQDALKQVTARYRAENLVKNREKVKLEALALVQNKLRSASKAFSDAPDTRQKLNAVPLVYVSDLPISNIDLSPELTRAIEQKQITEQQALAKNYELEKAKKEAEITRVQAQAEAEAVRIKGQALKSSPEVVDLEIAKKWDGHSPSTVVVGKGGGNVLLPLK